MVQFDFIDKLEEDHGFRVEIGKLVVNDNDNWIWEVTVRPDADAKGGVDFTVSGADVLLSTAVEMVKAALEAGAYI
jgi:hypothetical protein